MLVLSSEGRQIVDQLAQKYFVSSDAVAVLLEAVAAGGGYQAQFSHPDFGGMGQWQQGGMIMVGDMFNQGLKAKVSGLCEELSGYLRNQQMFAPPPAPAPGQGASLFVQGGGQSWWPGDLGSPAASGSQNDLNYAFFPSSRRLAIRQGGGVRVYDTGDQNIGGFSQQQGGDQSLTFTSQYGLVRVADLPQVYPAQAQPPAPAAPQFEAPAFQPAESPAPISAPVSSPQDATPSAGSDDVFAAIEKLAALHAKKILSDEEFAAKKAELLSRL
jgi:hypothetical protein